MVERPAAFWRSWPGLEVEGHAEVVEEGEGDLVDDGDAVLDVGGDAGVSSDGDEAVDRKGNLHGAECGVGRVARDDGTVGVGEVEHHLVGDEGVGGRRADVEAAHVLLTTGVDAVGGRSDFSAKARDMRDLDAIAEDVVALAVDAQPLHGEELAVGGDGLDVLDVSTGTGDGHGDI